MITRRLAGTVSALAKVRQLGLYAAFGFANTASDLILFLLLVHAFKLPPVLGTAFSIVLASVQSYFLNGLFTFGVSRKHLFSATRAFRFSLVCIASVIVAMVIVFYLQDSLGVVPAKVLSIGVNLVFGFWLNKTLVFSLRPTDDYKHPVS